MGAGFDAAAGGVEVGREAVSGFGRDDADCGGGGNGEQKQGEADRMITARVPHNAI